MRIDSVCADGILEKEIEKNRSEYNRLFILYATRQRTSNPPLMMITIFKLTKCKLFFNLHDTISPRGYLNFSIYVIQNTLPEPL